MSLPMISRSARNLLITLGIVTGLFLVWYYWPTPIQAPDDDTASQTITSSEISSEPLAIEEPSSPYTCPEDWSAFVMTNIPFAFCSPDEHGQPTEYGTNKEVHVTFSAENTPELVLLSADAPSDDGERTKFVDFECLLDANSQKEFETCFNPLDELVSIEEYLLPLGDRAFLATVKVRLLEGHARYRESSFILVPNVVNTAYHLEIAFNADQEEQARNMATYIFVGVDEPGSDL